MKPVIRFLLRHGVTWEEFGELSKRLYVDVAREDYGIQGRPTNNSRVAMMTGLSRREVARVRDLLDEPAEHFAKRRGNRISEILTAWHVDPEFLDESGQPRLLSEQGDRQSLARLYGRYAGDLPHKALRKEMLQRKLMTETADGGFRVLARDFTYTTLDPEIVRQMSVALHDHATTLDHNLNESRQAPVRFEGMADNMRVSPRSARRFMRLVEERGMEFLNEIDKWLSDHEVDESKAAHERSTRLGVGVYLIYDENEERQWK